MKIIGIAENNHVICDISKDEIARVFNNYSHYDYSTSKTTMKLEVGTEINLGEGYNFKNDIFEICQNMIVANKTFAKTQDTLLKFAELVTNKIDVGKRS